MKRTGLALNETINMMITVYVSSSSNPGKKGAGIRSLLCRSG
jgi:hypothetical protein